MHSAGHVDLITPDKSETRNQNDKKQKKTSTIIIIGLVVGLIVLSIIALFARGTREIRRRRLHQQFLAECNESNIEDDDDFVSVDLNDVIYTPKDTERKDDRDEESPGEEEKKKTKEEIIIEEAALNMMQLMNEEDSCDDSTIQTEKTPLGGDQKGFFRGQIDWLHKTLSQRYSTSIFDFFEDKPIPEQITIESPEVSSSSFEEEEGEGDSRYIEL